MLQDYFTSNAKLSFNLGMPLLNTGYGHRKTSLILPHRCRLEYRYLFWVIEY